MYLSNKTEQKNMVRAKIDAQTKAEQRLGTKLMFRCNVFKHKFNDFELGLKSFKIGR